MHQLSAGDMFGPFGITQFRPFKKLTRNPEMCPKVLQVTPYRGNL